MAKKTKKSAENIAAQTAAPAVETTPTVTPKLIVAQRKFDRWYDEDMGLYNNSIIIFDRGYYSEDMFRYCVEHGHLCVMRLKEGINLSKKCNGDMISILQGTSKEIGRAHV